MSEQEKADEALIAAAEQVALAKFGLSLAAAAGQDVTAERRQRLVVALAALRALAASQA